MLDVVTEEILDASIHKVKRIDVLFNIYCFQW